MNEIDDTVEMDPITDTDLDADAGPACGTPEAIVHLYVAYRLGEMTHINRGRYCCARHVPDVTSMYPEIGELERIIMLDGVAMTTVEPDGRVYVAVNLGDEPGTDPGWLNESATLCLGAPFAPPLP